MKPLYCSLGVVCRYIAYLLFVYLLLCAWRPARGQTTNYRLYGQVISADGEEPLIGASVLLKGTTNGATTDKGGHFTVSTSDNKVVLTVSFIGYRSLDTLLMLPLQSKLSLRLAQDPGMLEEVKVSTGYWETSKRLSTGNISKITADVIEKQPVTSVLAALSGRMPGVFVQTENGLPGGGIKVQIRGRGSITAGTDPLYIVNGVPFISTALNTISSNFQNINGPVSPLNSIPPADIESIEVLKDADATALYGSRGANGVVLIRTKRGNSNKTQVSLNTYFGSSQVTAFLRTLALPEYLALRKEAFANDAVEPTKVNAPDLTVWDPSLATDWSKELLGNKAHVTDTQLSVGGGSQHTDFRVGVIYRKEGSVLPGDHSYWRNGGQINLDHESSDEKLTLQAMASFTADQNNLIRSIDYAGTLLLPPNYPVYNPDGSYNWTLNNPIAMLGQKSESRTQNLNTQTTFSYAISKGLSMRVNLGYNQIQMKMYSSLPASSQNPANGPVSSASFGNNASQTMLAEPQMEYQTRWGKTKLTMLTGASWQKMTMEGSAITARDFTNEQMMENLGAAGTISSKSTNFSAYKYAALFGRLAADHLGKYLLSATFRRDGSSRFGPGNQFGNFGAIAAAWIFSEENALRNVLPALSFGKLRASYGITGNDQISNYQYLSSYASYYAYEQMPALSPATVANSRFGWESTRKLEAGMNLGFLNSRLEVDVTYFSHKSDNQLIGYPLPYMSGPFGTYQANFPGIVRNTGLEIELNTLNIKGRNFSWKSGFNLTALRNRLVEFPGLASSSYANIYEIGEDLSIIKGYRFTDVNPDNGTAQFEDINQDGLLTFAGDRVGIGKSSPDFYGGFSNTFTYSGFQLDVFLQFVKQQVQINPFPFMTPGAIGNVSDQVMGRWRQAGDLTAIQRAAAVAGTPAWTARNNIANSSASVMDGSYIRGKNISLSYTLPGTFCEKLKLTRCHLFVQGQNLFVLTFNSRLAGLDPETIRGSAITIPPMRSWAVGVNLSL